MHAVSGTVLVAGKAPANPIPVVIECAGTPGSGHARYSDVALTDDNGRYLTTLDRIPPSTPGETGRARFGGCSLQIRVPGFEPYRRELSSLDISRGGPIELHRILDRGRGNTISPTGYEAPKYARAGYAQSLDALAAGRTPECIRHLESAVGLWRRPRASRSALLRDPGAAALPVYL